MRNDRWLGEAIRTNGAYKLDFDACMLEPFPILWSYCHSPLYRLSVHIERRLFSPILLHLHINHCPLVGVIEDDVDVQWR